HAGVFFLERPIYSHPQASEPLPGRAERDESLPMAKSLPLYKRIKERMRADLVAGHANGGVERLPGERNLQLRSGGSRPTISKARGELATEGLVLRSPGSGSFLLPQPPSPALVALPSPPRIGY